MDSVTGLLGGFATCLTSTYLFCCFVGVLFGFLVGILPGIGTVGVIALLLPFSIQLNPTAALILFCGVYCGAKYGSSSLSVLMHLPGDPDSIVTCIDGYAMTQRGRASAALIICAIASFIAGTLGLIGLTLFARPLADLMLYLGPLEYLIIILGAVLVFMKASGGALSKAVLMALFGAILSTVGIDNLSQIHRFSFSFGGLEGGIDLSLIAMGFFGVSEIFKNMLAYDPFVFMMKPKEPPVINQATLPTSEKFRRSAAPILRGSLLGFFAGLLPGPSVVVSTFAAYALEKKISPKSSTFGQGAIEGVAAPEAANNAAIAGTLIPIFALGLPFCGTTAILLSGFLFHGISPGPLFIAKYPEVFWGVIASMYLGNLILLLVNYPLVVCLVQIIRIPSNILICVLYMLILTGAYSIHHSVFDLILVNVFGILGFLCRRAGYELSPLIIGFVIGPVFEERLAQVMLLGLNAPGKLFSHPVTITFFVLGITFVLFACDIPHLLKKCKRRKKENLYEK